MVSGTQLSCWQTIDINVKGNGVETYRIEGFLQICEKGGTLKTQSLLSKRARKVHAIKVDCKSDLNGMSD